MQRLLFIVLAIASLAIGLVVGTLNPDPVGLDLLWLQFEWPLGLIVLASFAVGLIVASALVYLWLVVPLRVRLRRARNAAPTPANTPSAAPSPAPDNHNGS